MKPNKDILVLTLFSILWICKPIPYQEVAYRKYVYQQAISRRGGNSGARAGFISQNPKSGTTTSGSGSSQYSSSNPKPQFRAVNGNGPGGGSAGGGSFDENNVPRKFEWETNPDYWNNYRYDPNLFKNKKNNEECELEEKVQEKFDESNAVIKLVDTALKNQDVKNEYDRIEKRLEEGINPVDIGKKFTPVASNKVLIKGDEGRYLVEVSGKQIKVLGICDRGNAKNVNSFKNLMNKMYGINLKYKL